MIVIRLYLLPRGPVGPDFLFKGRLIWSLPIFYTWPMNQDFIKMLHRPNKDCVTSEAGNEDGDTYLTGGGVPK
jgi:hypothetical protein